MAAAKKKTVQITCKGAGEIALALLKPLQGELKSLSKDDYERLKREIVADGFSFPVAVWENPKDAQLYIIDGHQRTETLRRMKKEGYYVPELPVVFIEAKDVDQAKNKLLAAASQYGQVQEDGLLAFLKELDLSAEEMAGRFRFADLDVQEFVEEHMLEEGDGDLGNFAEEGESEGDGETAQMVNVSSEQVRMVQLFFNGTTQPEFLQKCSKLQAILKCENLTDTVLEVIREAYSSLSED